MEMKLYEFDDKATKLPTDVILNINNYLVRCTKVPYKFTKSL